MATLTVFAGPDGSGKSTIVRMMSFDGKQDFLDADAIAKRINPADPQLVAFSASREVIRRRQEYIAKNQSFGMETTLATQGVLTTMQVAKDMRFYVDLIYVCVENSERSLQRVHERVARGGHDVPDDDIRRRYERSLLILPEAVRLADQAVILDNSVGRARTLLQANLGSVTWRPPDQPAWAKQILDQLS